MGAILSLLCAILPFLCGGPPPPPPAPAATLAPSFQPSAAPSAGPTEVPAAPESGILFDAPEVDFIQEVVVLLSEMTKIHKGRWKFDAKTCMGGGPTMRTGHAECATDGFVVDIESLQVFDNIVIGYATVGPGFISDWDEPGDYVLGVDGVAVVCQVSCMADSVSTAVLNEISFPNFNEEDVFVTRTPACEPGQRLLGISCYTDDRGKTRFFPRKLVARTASVNPNDGVLSATCGWESSGLLNNEIPYYRLNTRCARNPV